jgi:hypothetical protein
MKTLFLVLAVIVCGCGTTNGTNTSTNVTTRHCLSTSECGSGESCLSWHDNVSYPGRSESYSWREGYCVKE